MENPPLMVVVLAAGKGTRMKSELPKVLHEVCGVPMLGHVLDAAEALGRHSCYVIIGHGAEAVREYVGNRATCVIQEPQRGTGHAVQQVLPYLKDFEGHVLILSADVPLTSAAVAESLLAKVRTNPRLPLAVLTARIPDSGTLGRVITDGDGAVSRIVEAREASAEELAVDEVNAGVYAATGAFLRTYLPQVGLKNVQNELYLTDLVVLANRAGLRVERVISDDPAITLGVNTRVELAEVERLMQQRILKTLMLSGVTVIDPNTTYVGANVTVGQDSVILPGTIVSGNTVVGARCTIGPYSRLVDSQVGAGCTIQNSVLLQAVVGNDCTVGPFAYLRPGTDLAEHVKVGDFVEIKNARIGTHSKVPHLAYVGDATLGEHVNIGAGTITCNYDGKTKHRTTIGDHVHIGANTNLVAPVTVGNNASTGAGAVVIKDVPPDTTAVGVPARVLRPANPQ